MAGKYRALQAIYVRELNEYLQPGDEFEVEDDVLYPVLISRGVVEKVEESQPKPSRRPRELTVTKPVEEQNGTDN